MRPGNSYSKFYICPIRAFLAPLPSQLEELALAYCEERRRWLREELNATLLPHLAIFGIVFFGRRYDSTDFSLDPDREKVNLFIEQAPEVIGLTEAKI